MSQTLITSQRARRVRSVPSRRITEIATTTETRVETPAASPAQPNARLGRWRRRTEANTKPTSHKGVDHAKFTRAQVRRGSRSSRVGPSNSRLGFGRASRLAYCASQGRLLRRRPSYARSTRATLRRRDHVVDIHTAGCCVWHAGSTHKRQAD
jgi:hypothetical protein